MPASRFSNSGTRRTVSHWASVLGENVVALIVGTLVLAVFLCLAAIDPATWTFQSNAASHMRSELWHCLAIQDSSPGLAAMTRLHVSRLLTQQKAQTLRWGPLASRGVETSAHDQEHCGDHCQDRSSSQ